MKPWLLLQGQMKAELEEAAVPHPLHQLLPLSWAAHPCSHGVTQRQPFNPLTCGKTPFTTALAHAAAVPGGAGLLHWPALLWQGKIFSFGQWPGPPQLHTTTAGSIKPAQRSEAISRHSTGTEPRAAAQADTATSADSK